MTTVCNEFTSGSQGNGYGTKIECPCSYPGLLAAASPWISAKLYKERMLQYRNCVPLIMLQRDSGDGGSVKLSLDGKSLLIDYAMNPNDNQSLLNAMQGAAQILVAAGADEVATGHTSDAGFKVTKHEGRTSSEQGKEPSPSLQRYMALIQNRGMTDHEIGLFSAHQMGTCRMSASPLLGAVDPNGETWECDDLFVMDSSLFPTASGSNPMVTVLTLAYMLSVRLSYLIYGRDNMNGKSASPAACHALNFEEQQIAMETSKLREVTRSLNASVGYRPLTIFVGFGATVAIPLFCLVVRWQIQMWSLADQSYK
jgi:GMC oxidoreductase